MTPRMDSYALTLTRISSACLFLELLKLVHHNSKRDTGQIAALRAVLRAPNL